jgi:hypothetical protein
MKDIAAIIGPPGGLTMPILFRKERYGVYLLNLIFLIGARNISPEINPVEKLELPFRLFYLLIYAILGD